MSIAVARIAYDGEAVQDGSMDVRDLAPALLEIGALCERANEILNGDRTRITVNVKADFRPGSFEVCLDVVQTAGFGKYLKDLIFSDGAQNAKYILEWLGLIGVVPGISVLALYKRFRGRKAKVEKTLENGNIVIVFDGVAIEVSKEILALYNDEGTRARIEGALRPLLKEGIDTFEVRERDKVVETISQTEAKEAFDARRVSDEAKGSSVADDTYTTALEIVKVPFRDKLTWNFSRGSQKLSAEMKDVNFIQRHMAGLESFRTGDILVVRLRTQVWQLLEGLRVVHEIVEVIEHRHPPTQLNISD